MTERDLLKAVARRLSCPECLGSGIVTYYVNATGSANMPSHTKPCLCVARLRLELEHVESWDNRGAMP